MKGHTDNLSSDDLNGILSHACDAAMATWPLPRNGRKPVYCWCPEIAELRTSCLRAKRSMQRVRTDEVRMKRNEAYKAAELALNNDIKACFENLCQASNMSPWDDAYSVPTKGR